jgi:hypothetical protein
MKLDQLITHTISRMMGRMLRRMVVIAFLGLFILVALYHLTVAGTLALDAIYGPLHARLIVVAAYAALAIITLVYLVATRAKALPARSRASRGPRDVRIAELLESLLLGYTAARGKSRHS